MKHYVYAHYSIETGNLFYIGKGVGNRAWSLKRRTKKWHSACGSGGYKVEILIPDLEESEALYQEHLAISEFKPSGNFLRPWGKLRDSVYTRTPEQNRKMSERKKGIKNNWTNGHPWTGKTHTHNSKIQMSISRGGKPFYAKNKIGKVFGPFYYQAHAAEVLDIPNSGNIGGCLCGIVKSYKGFSFFREVAL